MSFRQQHIRQLLRIHLDEAGRGPLAGPVRVGAVASLAKVDGTQFADSKTLSEKKRHTAYAHIQDLEQQATLLTGAGRADHTVIDTQGIIPSLQQASLQAIFQLLKKHYLRTRRQQLLDSTYGVDHLAVLQLDSLFRKRKITLAVVEHIIDVENTLLVVQSVIIDGNHTF